MANSVKMFVGESRLVGLDFQKQPEILAGQTLSSGTVSAIPSGLSFNPTATVSGTILETLCQPASGNAGVTYDVKFTATTNAGIVMIDCLNVIVENC